MYLMLRRSSIYFFSCLLNTLIFTVGSYIYFGKKNNQCIPRPVTIAIVYSLDEHNFNISYCKMLIVLFIIQQFRKKLFCLLTKQV